MSKRENKEGDRNPKDTTLQSRQDSQTTIGPIYLKGEFPIKTVPASSSHKDTAKRKKAIPLKATPKDPHKEFIEKAGTYIYLYARSKGYSQFGATLFLALAAQESGYGDITSLANAYKLNNFWGIKKADGKHNRKFKSMEIGEHAGVDLIDTTPRYHSLFNLLKQDSPLLSQVDEGFKGYNLDANGKSYATWLSKNVMKGVTRRTIEAISEELPDIQHEIDEGEMQLPKGVSFLSNSFPSPLSNKDMLNENTIKELVKEKNDLLHVKRELETGESDGNYFMPKTNGLFNIGQPYKDNKGGEPGNVPRRAVPSFVPQWEGAPQRQSLSPSKAANLFDWGTENSYTGDNSPYSSNLSTTPGKPPYASTISSNNSGNNMGYTGKGTNMVQPAPSNSLPSTSQIKASSAMDSKGGGKDGGSAVNNIIIQTNDTHHNQSGITSNDIHDQVVAILTSAVADSRIGIDVH